MANTPLDDRQSQDDAYSPETLRTGELEAAKATSSQEESGDDSVAKRESLGDHVNNFTGKSAATNLTKGNFRALFKKKGVAGLVIGLILGGGLIGVSLGGPGLLLFHIAENLMDRFDSQNTSLSIRANKIIATKLTSSATTGSCTLVKIACRYTAPSNGLLRSLERNGIIAVDRNNNPIDIRKGPFPNTRPAGFLYTPPGQYGPPNLITANKFYGELRSNAEFRAAYHKAYNTRFFAYSVLDKVMTSIKTRFGFDSQNKLSQVGVDGKTINDTLAEELVPDDTGARAALDSGDDDKKKAVVKDLLVKEANDSAKKLARSGRGNAAMLVTGALCIAADVPGIVSKTARGYQLSQLIPYGATIVTAIYALKVGDGTPLMASALGTLFTQTVNGRSAMDSFGMRYALFGDTNTNGNGYKKFVPGGSVISALSGVQRFTDSNFTQSSCDVAANPVTGAAVTAALAPTVVGAIVNVVAGAVLSELIVAAAPGVIDTVMSVLPIENILGFFMGDLTQGLVGEPVGDGFVSSLAHLGGQSSNARGNMALTVEQAVDYQAMTNEVQLAYAEEDRVTHSPLDASNPNTMLGSFVNQLIPYYSQLTSVQGTASMFLSLVPQSFGSLFKPLTAQAADPAAQFSGMCDDPAIADNNIAAGPFCNIEYGIPVEYLDKDPYQVFNELVASGDVDPETGDVLGTEEEYVVGEALLEDTVGEKPTLASWLDLCADGSAALAENCVITDETANYALYTVDKSILDSMDYMDGNGGSTQAAVDTEAIESNLLAALSTQPVVNEQVSQPSLGSYIQLLASVKNFVHDNPLRIISSYIDLTRYSLWRA